MGLERPHKWLCHCRPHTSLLWLAVLQIPDPFFDHARGIDTTDTSAAINNSTPVRPAMSDDEEERAAILKRQEEVAAKINAAKDAVPNDDDDGMDAEGMCD